MATTIDELLVRIRADTKQLDAALGRIKSQVPQALPERPVSRFGASLKRLGGIAGAAATAIGGIAAVKIAQTGAEFENLRLSLETVFGGAEAANMAFGRIQRFAETSPFQIKDLTKAFIQLKTSGIEPTEQMLTTFSDAASVSTNALDTFQSLIRITQRSAGGGLGLEELEQLQERGLPVYDILETRLGRSRTQLSELGKTAEGAAKIMEELGKGLEERFGGTTSRKMETLTQKFSTLGDNFDKLADAIFLEGGFGSAIKTVVDLISDATKELAIFVKMMSTGQSREFVEATTLEGQRAAAQATLDELEARPASGNAKRGVNALISAQKTLIDSIDDKIEVRDAELKQDQTLQASQDAAKAAATEAAEAEDAATEARKDAQKSLQSLIDSTETPLEEYTRKITALNAEIARIGGGGESQFTVEQLQETIRRLGEEMDPVKKKTEEVAATFAETMAPAIAQTVNAFTTDFVNALMEGASALDSFKDLAKNIVSQIISTFLQMAVINKILNAIFGKSGFNVSGYSPLPELASGGSVSGSRPVLVGERGPELFIPHSAGSIKNAQNTRGMMGGGGVVINQSINLSTGVQATVRSEVMQMLPMINDVTKAGVLEAASRGGKYRRGLLGG